MTIDMSKVVKKPMTQQCADQCSKFLYGTSICIPKLREDMQALDNLLGCAVCAVLVESPYGEMYVQLLRDAWIALNSVCSEEVYIQGHYSSGPESLLPWREHLFKLAFRYKGVEYFTLMTGKGIDSIGIPISMEDKNILARVEY